MANEVNLTQTMDAQVWTKDWLETIKAKPEIPTDEGTMLGWFSNAIMAGYDEALRRQAKKVSNIEEMVKIQCSSGNWDCNSYMMGMANGLIVALATLKNEEPVFMSKPDVWLDDLPKNDNPPVAA